METQAGKKTRLGELVAAHNAQVRYLQGRVGHMKKPTRVRNGINEEGSLEH